MSDKFTHVALRKVNMLLDRDDFVEIQSIDITQITLRFIDKICIVDRLGRSMWRDND